MKHTINRMLAILIALLLAMPTVSFAEMPLDVPVVDNAFIEDEALSALEIDPAMDGAGVLPLLDPSEALNGDLTLADALQPEAGPAVTYRFIVDNAPVAAQEAWEGDAIQRPADPEAPEGYAFEGWFLEDGTRLFADVDGDGMDDPFIAHPDPRVAQVDVYARFAEVEETGDDAGDEADEGTPSDPEDAGKEEIPTDAQTPSPLGEGGGAEAPTEAVEPPEEMTTGDETEEEPTSSESPDGEPASPAPTLAPGEASEEPDEDDTPIDAQTPSPLGEGGGAEAPTEAVVPPEETTVGDETEAVVPPEETTTGEETEAVEPPEEMTTGEEAEEEDTPTDAPTPSPLGAMSST